MQQFADIKLRGCDDHLVRTLSRRTGQGPVPVGSPAHRPRILRKSHHHSGWPLPPAKQQEGRCTEMGRKAHRSPTVCAGWKGMCRQHQARNHRLFRRRPFAVVEGHHRICSKMTILPGGAGGAGVFKHESGQAMRRLKLFERVRRKDPRAPRSS